MMKVRIYTEQSLLVGETCVLEDAPSQHLLRVLRYRCGDQCALFNGDGAQYSAELCESSRAQATLKILDKTHPEMESCLRVTLAQCVSRGERMDYAIQKSVECGVHAIVPILSSRCGVKLTKERASKRQAHWQAIAIGASEQSGRCVVPKVALPVTLSAWLAQQQELILVADTSVKKKPPFSQSMPSCGILIGPEGGFSEEERRMLQQHDRCLNWSLGPRTLRTETAPVVALTQLQMLWGDMKCTNT